MFRTLACVLLIASVAVAQEPPKPLPPAPPGGLPAPPVQPPRPPEFPGPPAMPAMPGGMMLLNVVKVKVKDGGLVQQETVMVPVQETVTVTEVVNGQQVTKEVAVTKVVTKTMERTTKLKDLKASGADGKAISADDLEKKLKDGSTVVMVMGKLSDDQRKVFKDDTIFIEQGPPVPPGPPGGLPGGPPKGPPEPLEPVRPNFPGSDPDFPPIKK